MASVPVCQLGVSSSPAVNLFTQVRSVCVCVFFIATERICRRSQPLILREGRKKLSELLSVATGD